MDEQRTEGTEGSHPYFWITYTVTSPILIVFYSTFLLHTFKSRIYKFSYAMDALTALEDMARNACTATHYSDTQRWMDLFNFSLEQAEKEINDHFLPYLLRGIHLAGKNLELVYITSSTCIQLGKGPSATTLLQVLGSTL